MLRKHEIHLSFFKLLQISKKPSNIFIEKNKYISNLCYSKYLRQCLTQSTI